MDSRPGSQAKSGSGSRPVSQAKSVSGSRPASQAKEPGTPSSLGPLRTGRDRAEDDVPRTQSSASDATDIKKKEPLPPIGTPDLDPEDGTATPIQVDHGEYVPEVENLPHSTSEDLRSSLAASNKKRSSLSSRRPRIVNAYRRELDEDGNSSYSEDDRLDNLRDVKHNKSSSKLSEEDIRVVQGLDGREMTLVSITCQTEWSWLDDMRQNRRTRKHSSRSAKSAKSRSSASDGEEQDSEDDDDASQKGRNNTPQRLEKKTSFAPSAGSRQISSALTNKESITSEPYPSRADEYGIPMLNLSTDSDSSDDDSVYHMKTDEEQETGDKEAITLPSIGPPQILQYQREKEKQGIDVEGIAEVTAGEQEPSVVTDEELQKYKRQFMGIGEGVFEGLCEFCGSNVKPFPSMEAQEQRPPDELYCCDEYQTFVHFLVKHPLQEELQQADKMIDVKPHEPYGSKQARRQAKERAAQRMREREMARQQAAMEAKNASGARDANAGGFYQFARQMKTINYQLSSQKCLEDGWTLRPPSPLEDDNGDTDVFEPEPVLPPWGEGEGKNKETGLIQKLYKDGRPFVTLFPDGTGNVYYPSGRPAITITSVEQGLYTYVAQEDNSGSNMLAMFDPNGFGATYYKDDGSLRLYLDQTGGIELDSSGGKKRKWNWKDTVNHIHAPPLQPITFAMSPCLSVRVMGQDDITMTFTCKTRSCRFRVGSRLKLVAPENLSSPGFEEDDLYRDEVRTKIQSIMNRVSNLLRFPKCPRLDKLPTPQHLTSRKQKVQEMREHNAKTSRASKKEKGQTAISVN